MRRLRAVLTALALAAAGLVIPGVAVSPAAAGTYYPPAASRGGCSGELYHFNIITDTSPSGQTTSGAADAQVYYNNGTFNDLRKGKPGFGYTVKTARTNVTDLKAWINASTNVSTSTWKPKYQGAYPDGVASASGTATACIWIDAPSPIPNNFWSTHCLNYGGSVRGHLSGQTRYVNASTNPNPWPHVRVSGCTPFDYPWDTDPMFHPPTSKYENCMGYPQEAKPMRNHNEQYISKLVLFYQLALYPPGYSGPLKEGEFCAAVVPAEGWENVATSGIQVRMTLPTTSGDDVSVERASSGTRVAVNSPPGLYPVSGGECITVEGWSRMFSATENAVYDFFEFCGPLDKLPQPKNAHQIEEMYGDSTNCMQIFGRYIFFDSIWQGACDPGTFVAITDPVPGAGTWAADHPITLDLRCNRLTPDVNESRTVAAHADGGTSWNFNGYRCAFPIFGTVAEHSTKIWIHPRATYPQLSPNEIRFGT